VCAARETFFFSRKDNYDFSRCRSCDFVYLDPMPDQTTLNALYVQENHEAEPVYDKASSRLRRAWLKLPRFLPFALNKDTLDLGCGGGFITHVLGHVARSSTGIDISQNAIDYAARRFSKPRFLCRDFSDLLDSADRYDFIYSSEVIEHVSDINLYMRVLQLLTREGGHVYITTPDIGHPRVPVSINDWDVFTPPVHVQFFNRASAQRLFANYGFEILRFYPNRKPGLIFAARKVTTN
jgi:2-polyprenyl-3-methyl-5-hydroxy-6-metoxy-1,4-benzoquinol methylase